MEPDHYRFWPPGLPHDMPLPQTSLYGNLEATAARFPDKTAVVYYDTPLSYRAFKQDVDALAGFLQRRAGVKRGDRPGEGRAAALAGSRGPGPRGPVGT